MLRAAIVFALATTLIPDVTLAQREETHRGMNFAAGIGRGSMSLECKGCETTEQADISFLARLGWTFRQNLYLGIETTAFQKAQLVNQETVNATYVFGGPVVLWYPRRYSEPFFKLGAGVAHSSGTFNVASGTPTKLELNSPTLLIGVGADLRIGRTFSLTPYIDYHYMLSRDANFGEGAVTLKSSTLNLGLALTYH